MDAAHRSPGKNHTTRAIPDTCTSIRETFEALLEKHRGTVIRASELVCAVQVEAAGLLPRGERLVPHTVHVDHVVAPDALSVGVPVDDVSGAIPQRPPLEDRPVGGVAGVVPEGHLLPAADGGPVAPTNEDIALNDQAAIRR